MMRKIGRNEPCPCGSGKKYKKCCGRNNNTEVLNNAVNNELYNAHQELITFTTTEYQNMIEEEYVRIGKPFKLSGDAEEVHRTGLTPWIVSSVPCLKNNETILKRFYHSIQKKLSVRANEVLIRWLNTSPSVYEVISVNSAKKNFVKINELGTKDDYYIPYQNQSDFAEGSILIGSLIPFINHHDFLLTMVKLFDADIPKYTNLLKKYQTGNNDLTQLFPNFLADVLSDESQETEWSQPIHGEVAQLLSDHLLNKKLEQYLIDESLSHWNRFCEQVNPTIKRVEPYAAAMEYYTQHVILNNTNTKQTDIAKEYDTSASTLSNIYRRIVGVL